VIDLARTSNGRVTALARLDPADDPLGEAVRCLDAALERMYVMLVAVRERMLGGQSGGRELLIALDGCAVGADGPNGTVLRAVHSVLRQIEGRVDRDPLRQERTPGFDRALAAATIARTPDAPLPALDQPPGRWRPAAHRVTCRRRAEPRAARAPAA
jgi:hypothetical protein